MPAPRTMRRRALRTRARGAPTRATVNPAVARRGSTSAAEPPVAAGVDNTTVTVTPPDQAL
jgi:hypothetical protein